MMLIGMVAGCTSKGIMGGSDHITWQSLDEGKKEAMARNKPILVDFFVGVNCHRCERLVESVYDDRDLAAQIIRDFIPVRVNLNFQLNTEEKVLIGKLSPTCECVIGFLDPFGNIINDEKGRPLASEEPLTKDDFRWYLEQALKRSAPLAETSTQKR